MVKTLLLFICCSILSHVSSSSAPTFSESYNVKGVLYIPYTELREPFQAWYDGSNNRSRIDYYGGTVKTLQLGNKYKYGTAIKTTPVTTDKVTNKETCFQYNATSEESAITPQSVFPDLSKFEKIGNSEINSVSCEVWRSSLVYGTKVNNYTAYITYKRNHNKKIAVLVRYEMKGYDTLLGSHYDHYYINYNSYSTVTPKPSIFDVPDHLTCRPFPEASGHYVYTFNPMREFIHNDVKHVDHAWEEFHNKHKKSSEYKSVEEHVLRKSTFQQNLRYIESTNRANLSYKLAINYLADRTADELRALRGRKSSGTANNGGSPFPYSSEVLKSNAKHLPSDIDWRLYGAVTPVKDQSVCGSCWAFGTTGTIEGSYFLKYGKQISLSEQALVDCSWGYGNNGCDGGTDVSAYGWILKHGGLPTEAQYGQYLGQNGYCHVNGLPFVANLTGFVNVKTNDVTALKTALVNHGPISVAIDASHFSFSFYSSGVYYEPKCGSKEDDLDHAVLLVGYGTLYGKPYWLVKNSWSTYWGNDGYILISQKNNNCGIMTMPTYPVVE